MNTSANNKPIAVVGGGILGLTLALRLRQQGFNVTVLEASSDLGGLAGTMEIGGFCWDRFYHVVLLSDAHLLALLDELGLKETMHWGVTRTGFYTDGRLYSMSDLKEFLQFPPLRLPDKLRLGATIFYVSKIKNWKRLEQVTVSHWLRRLSGERTFSKIWLPLLKSKLGQDVDAANAAFIWAIINRMYAARRSGIKQEMFGYLHGGYASVIDHFRGLLAKKGVRWLLESDVSKIENQGEEVTVRTDSHGDMSFRDVILTVPCSEVARICPQLTGQEKNRLEGVKYQGVLCAALLLKKPLAGYYVTNITDEWVPFTAVIEMTALVDRSLFNGYSVVYLPLYLSHSSPWWSKSDEEVEEEFLEALDAMYPSFSRNDVLDFKVSRAGSVLPVPTLEYSSRWLPPPHTSLPGVFVVNSAQIPDGTMNVNELVALANRKAAELAEIL
jgi:protoporphyrinogen oxidase